jgi:hypothetical protein
MILLHLYMRLKHTFNSFSWRGGGEISLCATVLVISVTSPASRLEVMGTLTTAAGIRQVVAELN